MCSSHSYAHVYDLGSSKAYSGGEVEETSAFDVWYLLPWLSEAASKRQATPTRSTGQRFGKPLGALSTSLMALAHSSNSTSKRKLGTWRLSPPMLTPESCQLDLR